MRYHFRLCFRIHLFSFVVRTGDDVALGKNMTVNRRLEGQDPVRGSGGLPPEIADGAPTMAVGTTKYIKVVDDHQSDGVIYKH